MSTIAIHINELVSFYYCVDVLRIFLVLFLLVSVVLLVYLCRCLAHLSYVVLYYFNASQSCTNVFSSHCYFIIEFMLQPDSQKSTQNRKNNNRTALTQRTVSERRFTPQFIIQHFILKSVNKSKRLSTMHLCF